MNWDKGFKRLYIALSVLFFIGSLFFSYGETEMYNRIPCTKESGTCFSYTNSDGTLVENSLATRAFSERLPDAVESFVKCIVIWISFFALWFLIRWVLLGFKKTVSARNWPEGSDQ